jgi:hypothetical protein
LLLYREILGFNSFIHDGFAVLNFIPSSLHPKGLANFEVQSQMDTFPPPKGDDELSVLSAASSDDGILSDVCNEESPEVPSDDGIANICNGKEPAAPSDGGIIASVGGRGTAGSKNKLRTADGFVKGSYEKSSIDMGCS